MRLGLIARADNSGLGIQTHEFYKHMEPAKTMVVDISAFNHNTQYPARYSDGTFIYGFPQKEDINTFLQDLDVVFIAEAAYNPWLYTRARELGVKTAVQYNYEFMDWLVNPDYPRPDMLIAPSKWHYDDVDEWCKANGVEHVYLHCPVNRDLLAPRDVTEARTFLHMAGKSAAHDRNGTLTVIDAARYIKSGAKIKIHFQGEQGLPHQMTKTVQEYYDLLEASVGAFADHVQFEQTDYFDYRDAYTGSDVMILPRRYGGNCLPLNESLSLGMPVIMTDISPNNQLLPENWLIPAVQVGQFTPRTTVDIFGADPRALAAKIDYFYNLSAPDMFDQSAKARELGTIISWDWLKPHYQAALEALCTP